MLEPAPALEQGLTPPIYSFLTTGRAGTRLRFIASSAAEMPNSGAVGKYIISRAKKSKDLRPYPSPKVYPAGALFSLAPWVHIRPRQALLAGAGTFICSRLSSLPTMTKARHSRHGGKWGKT